MGRTTDELAAPIPNCPGWTAYNAAMHVARAAPERAALPGRCVDLDRPLIATEADCDDIVERLDRARERFAQHLHGSAPTEAG